MHVNFRGSDASAADIFHFLLSVVSAAYQALIFFFFSAYSVVSNLQRFLCLEWLQLNKSRRRRLKYLTAQNHLGQLPACSSDSFIDKDYLESSRFKAT